MLKIAQWLVADSIFVKLVQKALKGWSGARAQRHEPDSQVRRRTCASVLSAYGHASIVLLALVVVSAYDPASTVLRSPGGSGL